MTQKKMPEMMAAQGFAYRVEKTEGRSERVFQAYGALRIESKLDFPKKSSKKRKKQHA